MKYVCFMVYTYTIEYKIYLRFIFVYEPYSLQKTRFSWIQSKKVFF